MREVPGEADEEIEDDVPKMAHCILDIVPEDPEEEHVAADMQPATVQEHRRDERGVEGRVDLRVRRLEGRMMDEARRDDAPLIDEEVRILPAQRQHVQEDEHVDRDEDV